MLGSLKERLRPAIPAATRALSPYELIAVPIVWLVLIAVGAIVARQILPKPPEAVLLLVIYAVAGLASIRLPQGMTVGLSGAVLLALILALPPGEAVPAVILGGIIFVAARAALQPLLSSSANASLVVLIDSMAESVVDILVTLALSVIYYDLLGGKSLLDPAMPISVRWDTALLMVLLPVARRGILAAGLSLREGWQVVRRVHSRYWRIIMQSILWVALAPVLVHVIAFVETGIAAVGLATVGIVLAVYEVNRHTLNMTHMVALRQRVASLSDELLTAPDHAALVDRLRQGLNGSLHAGDLMLIDYTRGVPHSLTGPVANPYVESAIQTVAQTGTPVAYTAGDVRPDDDAPCCLFAMPLASRGELAGVVALHHSVGEAHAQPFQYALLERLAPYLTTALETLCLRRLSTSRGQELRVLETLSTKLSSGRSPDDLLQDICDTLLAITDANRIAVFLVGEDDLSIELAYARGFSARYEHVLGAMTLNDSRAVSIREARTLVVRNIAEDTDFLDAAPLAELEGYRSVIEVPLKLSEHAFGSIAVYFPKPLPESAEKVRLLQTVAGYVAILLQDARLIEAYRKRQGEMERMRSFGSALASSLSVVSVCRTVVGMLQATIDRPVIGIFVPDEEGLSFSIKAGTGLLAPQMRLNRDLVEGLIGSSRSYVLVDRQTTVPSAQHLLDRLELDSVLLVEVQLTYDILGLILIGPGPQPLSMAEIQQVEAIAMQTTAALQNARLFEQTEIMLSERLRELTTLEQIVQRMTRRLNLQEVIEQVALAASTATNADYCEVGVLDERGLVLPTVAATAGGQLTDVSGDTSWDVNRGVTARALAN
ncbi:MAG: GAF domain-containing protein, partial [Chloroflexi bacterium]|nr:GAF domain-containing protein [Chloroflexota bacterium]